MKTTTADIAVAAGWSGWLFSHIAQINELAQFVLLITSIGATIVAMRYHWKKTK
jgi:hypothetical protein